MLPPPGPARDLNLTAFYERGIGTRNWDVFSSSDPIRIVYVGDSTANLHQLVTSESPERHLHFPFPSSKPHLPWKPDSAQAGPGSYLTAAISQDLSSFPARPVRDALVQTYFDDIHPGLPIIDEEEFRRQYQDPADPPPLLVFHAVLLAASRVNNHPMVASARPTVTATLFRRTKSLFDMRYENDRVFLVQAALLMAWHVEDSDTISNNAYYWVGQATRIALGLGMHRDLSNRSRSIMPAPDRRTYRKIWWAVLQAETYTALEYGRPSMIKSEDFDQPPLDDEDFYNINGTADILVRKDFCVLNAELCQIALDVLSLNAPRARLVDARIDARLADLATRMPHTHDFWSCQLRISHSLVTLISHRRGRNADSALLSREAASTILTTFETVMVQGSIRKCSVHCTTALLAAATQFSQDAKSATESGSVMRAVAAHAQLERALRPMEALSAYWPHAEALHKLCVSLCGRCSERIKSSNVQQPVDAVGIDANGYVDIPLQDIMAGYQLPELGQMFVAEDWMNTF